MIRPMKGMTAMATPKDNLGLVKWAQVWLGQAYWMGTCCYNCTAALLARKTKQYPSSYPESRMSRYKADIAAGKKCSDCIGLIKGYLWTREDGKLVYKLDNRPDKGANGMISICFVPFYTKFCWGVIFCNKHVSFIL